MLTAAIYIVFAFLLIVCALLLLVVMMQRPKQEGLGAAFGAQMTDQAFGAQTTDVLKKGTVLFGTLFMLLCFILAVLMNRQFQQSKSTLATTTDGVPAATAPVAPEAAAPAPAAEQTPSPSLDLEQFTVPAPAPEPTSEAPEAAPAEQPVEQSSEQPAA